MICWRANPDNPLDVCNATGADLVAFLAQQHPTGWLVLKVALVASVVLSLGVAAAAALVAWRQRLVARLEQEQIVAEVARARDRARARRPPVYPVRCTGAAETVWLRRGADGRLEPDEPRAP